VPSPFTPSTIPSGGASPLTTKGDIYTYTNADARLGVGSDGQVLVASSGQSTGLLWSAGSSISAMTLLSTTTRATDGTFDIQSISQSYNDLMLMCLVRGTDAGALDSLRMRFNNVSTATYGSQLVDSTGTTVAAKQDNDATSLQAAEWISAGGAAANLFSAVQIWIPGYTSTTWAKQFVSTSFLPITVSNAGRGIDLQGGFTAATTAVSRIQLFGGTTANLLTASTVRVYGIL